LSRKGITIHCGWRGRKADHDEEINTMVFGWIEKMDQEDRMRRGIGKMD
jgi:predicted small metal-binding protein